MSTHHEPLLVELFTEELPPKALLRLAQAFGKHLADELAHCGLVADGSSSTLFATPRRLAIRIDQVLERAPDREVELKGPSIKVGLSADGQPTQALIKWAQKQSVDVGALHRGSDGKQEVFFARSRVAGAALDDVIEPLIDAALSRLPVPKLMQYQLADGVTNVSFVRPAHGLVVLHGARVIPATVLGLQAGRRTWGHRFMSEGPIDIDHAGHYEQTLSSKGRVIARFEERRQRIESALDEQARRLGASLGEPDDVSALLDEVTALVEWPAVYVGHFDPEFLEVPQECLILTMRTNQKYFPLFDAAGRLQPRFLIVSNMQVADPSLIVDGNERVVRPRLADARFFYEQDRRQSLESRLPQLASVVYHARLGTQAQRTQRVRMIAHRIARALSLDEAQAERAASLAKADLLTGMVGEFPELQGTMGRYYARHDGEALEVADAIEQQYQPRFAGDHLPASPLGTALALADKLETLAGLFGIGQVPTGDRDPFALRRHALGVVRMIIEKPLPLKLSGLIEDALASFAATDATGAKAAGADAQPAARPDKKAEAQFNEKGAAAGALRDFFIDRLSSYLREQGYSASEVASVTEQTPDALALVPPRLEAVRAFSAMPQAQALAAANKRIGNILRKTPAPDDMSVHAGLLLEPAERQLDEAVQRLTPRIDEHIVRQDYTSALGLLAGLREPVDAFFDQVMVMTEDADVRNNRLALLSRVHRMLNQVADISKILVT